MEVPDWLTIQNVSRLVVMIFAFLLHYHFISNRFKAANEEAIKVLENMPDPEPEN